jgi:hypothetical protein
MTRGRQTARNGHGTAAVVSSCAGSTRTRPATRSGWLNATSCASRPPQLCPTKTQRPSPARLTSVATAGVTVPRGQCGSAAQTTSLARGDHQLLAPALVRSQMLSLLY